MTALALPRGRGIGAEVSAQSSLSGGVNTGRHLPVPGDLTPRLPYGESNSRPGHLQIVDHFVQEAGGRGPIDDAVIVRQAQRHHQPRLDPVVDHHRQLAATGPVNKIATFGGLMIGVE